MPLSSAYPAVKRRLQEWCGWPVLEEALRLHPSLQVYVAGGAVRNTLMGLTATTKDWDFFLGGASVADSVEHFRKFGRLSETPYGAPRWFPHEESSQYADLIPIQNFVPGLWRCLDIVDVLNQFDFTANAVAFDVFSGVAFDPQNGARDAINRTMKMVRFDYPEGPYITGAKLNRNDVLWFRIVHYASVLDLSIEPITRDWLISRRNAVEVKDEFMREFFLPNMTAWEKLCA